MICTLCGETIPDGSYDCPCCGHVNMNYNQPGYAQQYGGVKHNNSNQNAYGQSQGQYSQTHNTYDQSQGAQQYSNNFAQSVNNQSQSMGMQYGHPAPGNNGQQMVNSNNVPSFNPQAFLKVEGLIKSYGEKERKIKILNSLDFSIEEGQICTILGPSGSGKSTLLNLIGGLDNADSGKIIVDGEDILGLSNNQLALFRRNSLGFVFQFYNLVPNLTVRENIEVCSYLTKDSMNVDEVMEVLGLTEHQKKFPRQLSGGQQQRTALARAIIKKPKLLLCDEPTGALDYKTSKEMLELIERVNRTYSTTMLIVTHNAAISQMSHRVIKLRDGVISDNIINGTLISARDVTW